MLIKLKRKLKRWIGLDDLDTQITCLAEIVAEGVIKIDIFTNKVTDAQDNYITIRNLILDEVRTLLLLPEKDRIEVLDKLIAKTPNDILFNVQRQQTL